jgi:hypothetical protein
MIDDAKRHTVQRHPVQRNPVRVRALTSIEQRLQTAP